MAKTKVDKYGRWWQLPAAERCKVCGQPDNTGDCNHKRLTLAQVKDLGGVNRARNCPCEQLSQDSHACEECYKVLWGYKEKNRR